MKTRYLAFGLALIVLGLIAVGCGGGGSTPPASAPTLAATQAAAPAATTATGGNTPAPATSGGVKLNTNVSGTIDLWHFWGSQSRRGAIRRVIGICQQQLPKIKVNETFKPFGDIWTANIAAVAAGSGMPDVIVEDRPQLYQRGLDKIDTDLQPYIDRDGFDTTKFYPFTWEQTLYNGHSYGIPYETDVRVLYWDKNLFKQAGLDPETPPKTWDDLWAMADKLDKKNPDGTYARIGFFPLINIGPDIWSYTNGVQFVQNGKPVVNSPEVVQTFEWIKKWVDRYGGWANIQKFEAGLAAAPNDAFMSGKVAMIADIQGYVSQITFFDPRIKLDDGKTNDRLDYGVADLPTNAGKPKGTWSGGFALSIPRGAKNPDAAWEFIKCATDAQAEASWARDTYALAPNKNANNDPTLMADPRWPFFVSALQYSHVEPFVKAYPNWTQEIGGPLQEDIWKNDNAQKALDAAQQKIDAQMAKGQP